MATTVFKWKFSIFQEETLEETAALSVKMIS